MNLVTTIPTAYSSINEEARKRTRSDVSDFLSSVIAHSGEGVQEASEKVSNLFNEILPLLPEDKQHLLLDLEEAENEYSYYESEAIIKYLLDHGEELKKAILDFI